MGNNIKNWEEFLKDVPTDALISELENRKRNNLNVSSEALEIMTELVSALKEFGAYSLEDRGPNEVMDINSIVRRLSNKSIVEIANILTEILDNYQGEYFHASYLVNTIIGEFDSHKDFESLLDSDKRFEY